MQKSRLANAGLTGKNLILLFSVVCFHTTLSCSANAEGYLCVAEKAGGFSFDPQYKSWNVTSFKVDLKKYSLTKINGIWKWTAFGEREPYLDVCEESGTYITCHGAYDIRLSTVKLRYQMIYPFGFISGADDGKDTPYIEIGTCTLI